MNILINVACALDYLHNHCSTTVVHGDLKPHNILLDDDMVAHIGDFALAWFLESSLNQSSNKKFDFPINVSNEEYIFGSEMTTSGDVYSFGISLLEVMTEKKPTDDIFNEGLSLHKFVCMALEDHLTHAIDEELLKYHHMNAIAMKSIALTLKIGVSCSVDFAPHRMNIKDVVNELQNILDTIQNS
ncbi:receptor kinase-like protein Xa21 [Bidens hawaiensis]|uniref:receptor kinase-like protein Xa21 n=1 Tax=Bidens hawaiensis TaxID=980011 RepID=UPI00404949D0